MNERAHISILRRMAGQAGDAAPVSPLSTSRAVRLALVKAGSDACGLVLDVVSTDEANSRLDAMLAGLDAGVMLVGLHRQDRLIGFVAVDVQLRAAVLEMQILGRLLAKAAADRPATGTDKALCDPFLAAFLSSLPPAVAGTDYAAWVADLQLGDQITDIRAAGMALADGDYRVLTMQMHLGGADRKAGLALALPILAAAPAPEPAAPREDDWHTAFPAAVRDASAELTAQLARINVPLRQAQAFAIGDVVDLPGCSVMSVRLFAPDGRCVAQGKLGQMSGKRAVRIMAPVAAQMDDLPSKPVPPAPAGQSGDNPPLSPAENPDAPLPP